MTDWASEEKSGVKFGVLGTVDSKNKARTRTIAIRQINEWGILFFTQRGSEKVQHIKQNSFVSLTIYLPDSKRQIVVDGTAEALSDKENSQYWNTYPKTRNATQTRDIKPFWIRGRSPAPPTRVYPLARGRT